MTGYATSKSSSLNLMLKQVSRSFYLSIRVLPRQIRPQIGLTYILARITDTVADAQSAPPELRLATLLRMRREIAAAVEGVASQRPEFRDLSCRMLPIDRALVDSFPDALEMIRHYRAPDRLIMGEVLARITSGQEMDLSRFGAARADRIAAFDTDEELDDYTYRVAGCVGEFWTKMCRGHLFPETTIPDALLQQTGVRFGKGLQLVNILRDLPRDLRQGRCYIPRAQLAARSISPESLLEPATMGEFRPLYDHYLQRAEEYLAAGRTYVDALPRSQVRVRLACTLPMMIGTETLARLRTRNVLDGTHTIKISRPEVRHLILASLFHCLRPARQRP